MTVYLDDARKPQGCYVLSTLIADTDKELRAFAQAIGLDPSWILEPPEGNDLRAYVSPGLGLLALKRKAVEITAEQSIAMRWHRHHHGALGTPAGALQRFNQERDKGEHHDGNRNHRQ